jgi:hypothetical protein
MSMTVKTFKRDLENVSTDLQGASRGIGVITTSLSDGHGKLNEIQTTVTVLPGMAENVERLLNLQVKCIFTALI